MSTGTSHFCLGLVLLFFASMAVLAFYSRLPMAGSLFVSAGALFVFAATIKRIEYRVDWMNRLDRWWEARRSRRLPR